MRFTMSQCPPLGHGATPAGVPDCLAGGAGLGPPITYLFGGPVWPHPLCCILLLLLFI